MLFVGILMQVILLIISGFTNGSIWYIPLSELLPFVKLPGYLENIIFMQIAGGFVIIGGLNYVINNLHYGLTKTT
jgi:hypothetical protein